MITKAKLKDIKSLQLKKNRQEQQCFLVEGAKSVLELVHSDFEIETIICTESFLSQYDEIEKKMSQVVNVVSEKILTTVGTFKNNTQALAVATTKPNLAPKLLNDKLVLVMDDVRDPGNLGTIIRIADWYGIANIIASETTAEFYNPKVISATMGSFTRVGMYYTHLPTFLMNCKTQVSGAFMDGENIHNAKLSKGGLLVMGNESNGISTEVEAFVTRKLTIPKFGKAESLNVAVATAIMCDRLV